MCHHITVIYAPLHKQRVRIKKYLRSHGYSFHRHREVFFIGPVPRDDFPSFQRWLDKQEAYGEEAERYADRTLRAELIIYCAEERFISRLEHPDL